MVPRTSTIAAVEAELPPLRAYAGRHSWAINWNEEALTLVVEGRHPADGSPLQLHAELGGYRAVPPAWNIVAVAPEVPEKRRFPAAGTLPGGVGSIFHPTGVICAPFNRLAYKQHGGPHQDWGLATWLDVRGTVRATNLAEMIAQIAVHLRYSGGWKK